MFSFEDGAPVFVYRKLDETVFATDGWSSDLRDELVLGWDTHSQDFH